MSVWLTIPTRGDHEALLDVIVDTAGVPRDRVVIVRTGDCMVPPGVRVVDDRGPLNIHRWWNAGIDAAAANGAEYVAVLNDDVRLRATSLTLMAGAMAMTDAAVCWSATTRITGWAFMLRVGAVRPDERFRWWYGDNDLALQAGDRWVGIDARIDHLAGNAATTASDELQRIIRADETAFNEKWGDL